MKTRDGIGLLVVGVVMGYYLWGIEPNYIDNLRADEGTSYILAKTNRDYPSGDQVVVFHGLGGLGLGSNRTACMHVARLWAATITEWEDESDSWVCVGAGGAGGGKPWWKFWPFP